MSADNTPEGLVHWIGEHNNTLHGNGYKSPGMEHASGDEDEVTCKLCHSLLDRRAREAAEHPATPAKVERPHHWINQNGRCDNGQMMDSGDSDDGDYVSALGDLERILATRTRMAAEAGEERGTLAEQLRRAGL